MTYQGIFLKYSCCGAKPLRELRSSRPRRASRNRSGCDTRRIGDIDAPTDVSPWDRTKRTRAQNLGRPRPPFTRRRVEGTHPKAGHHVCVRHHAPPCLACDAAMDRTSDLASCCSTRWPRGTTYSLCPPLFQRMARAEASASRGERGRWLSNASAFSAAESRAAPEKMRQKRSVSSAAAVTTVVPSGD